MTDTTAYAVPVSWYADALRQLVVVPNPAAEYRVSGAFLTGILQHLEALAKAQGERTIGAIVAELHAPLNPDHAAMLKAELRRAELARDERNFAVAAEQPA